MRSVRQRNFSAAGPVRSSDWSCRSERTAGLAQLYATFARNRLPMDEFAKLVSGAQTVTAAKLQEVGRSRLHPEDATIVIVGDVQKLLPKLPQALGLSPADVQRRDVANRSPRRPPSNSESTPRSAVAPKFYKFAELQLDRMRIMDVTKVLGGAVRHCLCTMPQTETSDGPQFQLCRSVGRSCPRQKKGRGPGAHLGRLRLRNRSALPATGREWSQWIDHFRYPSS